jgi:hypothetical protein
MMRSVYETSEFHDQGDHAGLREPAPTAARAVWVGISSTPIETDAGEIAAGPSEAGDQACCNRVGAGVENDRDRRGRVLRRERRSVTALGHDHVDLAGDEVGSQRGQPIKLTLGPAVFDRHVLSVEVAGFAQPLAESGELQLNQRFHAGVKPAKEADHRHRLLLLRAGEERIRRRAGENRHEIAASHSHPPHVVDMNYRATGPFPIAGESRLPTHNGNSLVRPLQRPSSQGKFRRGATALRRVVTGCRARPLLPIATK